jgi:hypothetical protein
MTGDERSRADDVNELERKNDSRRQLFRGRQRQSEITKSILDR